MTTEAENDCHWIGYGKPASPCGLPFPATLGRRWTSAREDTTCPACLTAMGEPAGPRVAFGICDACEAEGDMEDLRQGFVVCKAGTGCNPRVVSGLDTAAAFGICDACEAEGDMEDLRQGFVVCKAGTGCNPRVVSGLDTAAATPADARRCEITDCQGHVDPLRGGAICEPHLYGRSRKDPVPPPAPPGQVKVTHFAQDTVGLVTRCGLKWSKSNRFAWTDGEDETPVTCPACLAPAAAPAPGVGEGREMTTEQACEADEAGDSIEWSLDYGKSWDHFDGWDQTGFASQFRRARYRRRPEPLPAPAPRVSRVQEMVREEAGFFEGNGNTFPLVSVEQAEAIAKRVVEAHQEEIRRRLNGWQGGSIAELLDRACAAMLEPR